MTLHLSSRNKLIESASKKWPLFKEKRKHRLAQLNRQDGGAEKITENILEDLFSSILDWDLSNINYQMQYCDMLLTHLGVKYLLIEAKYPHDFINNRSSFNKALSQVLRYAQDHKVQKIAVSDGCRLYAADICETRLVKRVDVFLDDENFPEELWFLSLHGIYRSLEEESNLNTMPANEDLFHPKHKLPSSHFAYVGNPNEAATWKLPYKLLDGSIDLKRLPKAIGAVAFNYRGNKVKDIPEKEIPKVLRILYDAAISAKMMPHQNPGTSKTYYKFSEIMQQFNIDKLAKN